MKTLSIEGGREGVVLKTIQISQLKISRNATIHSITSALKEHGYAPVPANLEVPECLIGKGVQVIRGPNRFEEKFSPTPIFSERKKFNPNTFIIVRKVDGEKGK
jgi:hypothetical protein